MKAIPVNITKFKVTIHRPDWECYVTNLSEPKLGADTAEDSQCTDSAIGTTDEYTVTVHSNMNERHVEVHDKNGQEVNDFKIDIIEEAK